MQDGRMHKFAQKVLNLSDMTYQFKNFISGKSENKGFFFLFPFSLFLFLAINYIYGIQYESDTIL